jgi:hypothetical protein
LLMGKAVRELAHSLCQRGEPIRNKAMTHPSKLRDMDRVDRHLKGQKVWSDRNSGVNMSPIASTMAISRRGELTRQKKKQPWRCHQSSSAAIRGKCSWAKCPEIEKSKGIPKRAYNTLMQCKECTANAGCNIYLCNDTKNGEVVSCHCCHVMYHKRNHNKAFLSDKRVIG